eukprot:TRINITY_DN86729_c0_g1_i1.p1 TRINITY_DN86729_c0_g1~~TRINITY_DN86729_c0_g1_i1.p1  ORF type:complete len:416 (-),score=15.71 TRINITY_DN86729_c0_g1_i1:1-1248(-)
MSKIPAVGSPPSRLSESCRGKTKFKTFVYPVAVRKAEPSYPSSAPDKHTVLFQSTAEACGEGGAALLHHNRVVSASGSRPSQQRDLWLSLRPLGRSSSSPSCSTVSRRTTQASVPHHLNINSAAYRNAVNACPSMMPQQQQATCVGGISGDEGVENFRHASGSDNSSIAEKPEKTHQLYRTMSDECIAQRRWRQLRFTLMVVGRITRPETSIVKDLGELDEDLNPYDEEFAGNEHRRSNHLSAPYSGGKGAATLFTTSPSSPFELALKNHRLRQRLFEAATKGDVRDWDEAYKKDPNRALFDGTSKMSNVNVYSDHGATQLYIAAQNGHADMCFMLLQRGADPSLPSKVDDTQEELPVHCAARWGHSECVKLLLSSREYSKKTLRQIHRVALNERTKCEVERFIHKRPTRCCKVS